MIGTELTWVSKTTKESRVYHVADSKARPGETYEVWSSRTLDKFVAMSSADLLRPLYFSTVIEAKQACQQHEDTTAERGDACRSE